MIDQLSDQEQKDMVKRWWHQYGVPLLIAIVIGSGIGFGWRYYQSYKVDRQVQASAVYMEVLKALNDKDQEALAQYAEKMEKYHSSSSYESLTRLLLAKNEMDQKKYDNALMDLQWVSEHSTVPALKSIATLRSARINLEKGEYAQALDQLKSLDDTSYASLAASVRGDVYSAQGKFTEANKAYMTAEKGMQEKGVNDPLLSMKLMQVPKDKSNKT